MPETSGSVLRSRPFRAVLASEVVSTTGTQMTWLALPWFVLLTTGSATRMALVIAAELVGIASALLCQAVGAAGAPWRGGRCSSATACERR